MKIELVEPKRALVKRRLRMVAVIAAMLTLAGCGSGNIKDLLKDSPEQKEQPTE